MLKIWEQVKDRVGKALHRPEAEKAGRMAELADPKFKEIIRAFERADSPEEKEKQRQRARDLFYAVADNIKDYPKKAEILDQHWGQGPFVDGLVSYGGSLIDERPWTLDGFKDRLDVWSQTAGIVEGFDYGPSTVVDAHGQEKEIRFTSPQEALVVENRDEQLLHYLQEKTGVSGEDSASYKKAVNVLNLARRAHVDYFSPKVQEGLREKNAAMHPEPILRSRVNKSSPDAQWHPTNLIDTTAYFISTFDLGSAERNKFVGDFKAQVLDEIANAAAINDPSQLRERVEQILLQAREVYEQAYREASKDAKGGVENIRTTQEHRNAQHETHTVNSVLLVKKGKLKSQNALPVVEFSEAHKTHGWPKESAAAEPVAQPVVEAPKPEPTTEAVKPNRAREAYRRRMSDPGRLPRPIERLDAKIDFDDARQLNHKLMPMLPDGIEPARFTAVMLRLARYNRGLSVQPGMIGYNEEFRKRSKLVEDQSIPGDKSIIDSTLIKLMRKIDEAPVDEDKRRAMRNFILQPIIELYEHTTVDDLDLDDGRDEMRASFTNMLNKPISTDKDYIQNVIREAKKGAEMEDQALIPAIDKELPFAKGDRKKELLEQKEKLQQRIEKDLKAVDERFKTQEGLYFQAADNLAYIDDNFARLMGEHNLSDFAPASFDNSKRLRERPKPPQPSLERIADYRWE